MTSCRSTSSSASFRCALSAASCSAASAGSPGNGAAPAVGDAVRQSLASGQIIHGVVVRLTPGQNPVADGQNVVKVHAQCMSVPGLIPSQIRVKAEQNAPNVNVKVVQLPPRQRMVAGGQSCPLDISQ